MTLWVKKPGLILGLALLTFACEDPGEIGLDLNPENGAFVARFQEFNLDNSVLLYDEILSDNTTRIDSSDNYQSGGRLLSGVYSTPDFGKLQSKAFAGLYLAPETFGFSDQEGDYVLDSLVLRMKVDYLYGKELTGQKSISIHELSDSLEVERKYFTKSSTSYSQDPLGEFSFDFSSFDTVKVDTVISARLSDELGLRFLKEAEENDSSYLNNNLFREFFHGLAYVSAESNDLLIGMVPESRGSYLRLYYHSSEADSLFEDFMFFDLDSLPGNKTKYYNNITLDRTGSPIEGISDYYTEFETDNEHSYLQASAGVFTKLNMDKYEQFLDTIGFLVINRAEIEIPVLEYADKITPSSTLEMYAVDENNRFIEEYVNGRPNPVYRIVPEGKLSFRKDSDANKGIYVADVTSYIQQIAIDEDLETELLLGQPGLWNSILSVNQSVIKKDSISLKVYYSVLQ